VPNPLLVEQIAAALGTRRDFVEKDWYVVQALRALASFDHGEIQPVFSGGTSLSIGWNLIKRFSEDIDFKVIMPGGMSQATAKKLRSSYRKEILNMLIGAGFQLAADPLVGNQSSFFSAQLAYKSEFPTGPGLRPHLRLEMSFQSPALPPIERPIQSLVSKAQNVAPEVPAFACIDPIETAADKLSALAWRVCARQRGSVNDDPTIIRHLHDLAALEQMAKSSTEFSRLVQQIAIADSERGDDNVPNDPDQRVTRMLELLTTDAEWERDYTEFVQNVSFASPEETISYAKGLDALRKLCTM